MVRGYVSFVVWLVVVGCGFCFVGVGCCGVVVRLGGAVGW